MYPYPMFKPAMVPSVYPTVSPYLPPARPQPLGGHPNSSQDVATHASPNCSGRVSPAGSSSDESRNLIPATSPLPPSNPATTKRPRPDGGRTCYTRKQVRAMEQIFSENKYPDYDVIENMSAEIGISHKRIKVWFQNKRARSKNRGPDPLSPLSPHMVAMMTSSRGINNMMVQFPVLTPTMVSPFPGFPSTTMLPSAVY